MEAKPYLIENKLVDARKARHLSGLTATLCLAEHTFLKSRKYYSGRRGGRGSDFSEPSSARPPPSGVTDCGVLWVRPGDLFN